MSENPNTDILSNAVLQQLARIADALEKLAAGGEPVAPNYQRPLEDYAHFDWSSIGAEVVRSDDDGPTHVEHRGMLYIRRCPDNKFGEAIWYSRAVGKDEDGKNKYVSLISFRKISQAEPLPPKVAGQVHNPNPPSRPAAPPSMRPAPVVPPTTQSTLPPATKVNQPPIVEQPVRPAGDQRETEPRSPCEVKDQVGYQGYYKTAASKQFGLTNAEARSIAQIVGISVMNATPTTNFAAAMRALWYFAEAKGTFKIDLDTSANLYRSCQMDPGRATEALRTRFQPALR